MSKLTKNQRIAALEAQVKILIDNEKQRGIGNQFMTLKCIQGNRYFTKDATYCASKLHDRTVVTSNFGSRKGLEVNKNIFGGYKVADDNQTAVFQVIGADAEPEPKPKQLNQSVFDGLDEKWRFALIASNGVASKLTGEVVFEDGLYQNKNKLECIDIEVIGDGYDTTNWQNSLIERDKVELTGSGYYHSRIASHLLELGQKLVVCFASNISEADALSEKRIEVITSVDTEFTDADEYGWQFVVPINNQGEPLTAKDVGL